MAKFLADTANLTQTGAILGTPHYMSPEQVLGETLDARSDLYALGCVMYRCLAGRCPFDGDNSFAVLAAHLTQAAPPLAQVAPHVDPLLEGIVGKAMEKGRDKRFRSADEMRIALETWQRSPAAELGASVDDASTTAMDVLTPAKLDQARQHLGHRPADASLPRPRTERAAPASGTDAIQDDAATRMFQAVSATEASDSRPAYDPDATRLEIPTPAEPPAAARGGAAAGSQADGPSRQGLRRRGGAVGSEGKLGADGKSGPRPVAPAGGTTMRGQSSAPVRAAPRKGAPRDPTPAPQAAAERSALHMAGIGLAVGLALVALASAGWWAVRSWTASRVPAAAVGQPGARVATSRAAGPTAGAGDVAAAAPAAPAVQAAAATTPTTDVAAVPDTGAAGRAATAAALATAATPTAVAGDDAARVAAGATPGTGAADPSLDVSAVAAAASDRPRLGDRGDPPRPRPRPTTAPVGASGRPAAVAAATPKRPAGDPVCSDEGSASWCQRCPAALKLPPTAQWYCACRKARGETASLTYRCSCEFPNEQHAKGSAAWCQCHGGDPACAD
ncbi:MAG: hypothetical protein EXR79_15025 [Myxococcales bacterium]|nr:hypothetical protein [Myxococcales bacterium]